RNMANCKAHKSRNMSRAAPACKNQVKRMTAIDKTRQADCTLVNERNPPAAVIHTENGILGSNPQVAPEREFESSSNSIAFYRCNNRLAKEHTRDAQRPIAILSNAQSPRLILHSREIEA